MTDLGRTIAPDQLSLFEGSPLTAAVAALADAGSEARGAVFTRREVVDLILDLVGYTANQPLHLARILEPATGRGDFLLPTIDRLFGAYERLPASERHGVVEDLGDCVRAVELHRVSYDETRALVNGALLDRGIGVRDAEALCDAWLRQVDFLLLPGAEPWMLGAPDQLGLARRLEADFPTLEEAGCKVGIGVATGADEVFIGPFEGLDVEYDRKLPLAMTRDILTGTVKWRGLASISTRNNLVTGMGCWTMTSRLRQIE